MSKKLLLFAFTLLMANFISAQTTEEIQAQIAEKQATLKAKKGEVAALEGDVAKLKESLVIYPNWKVGALGTIGGNFNQFNNWLGSDNPNTASSSFGFTGNAYANLNDKKYFWRNGLNLNISKTKLVKDSKIEDSLPDSLKSEFETTGDAINLTSLFGWKLTEKWAISAMAEYRSTILSNFNNPGYLDIGAGATWTPIPEMVVVFHPLNYNFVMAKDDVSFESSLGCKIMADYTKSLPRGIAWRSNLSAFASYSDFKNFSNWTWVNGLNLTVWKGIGVGFELGLRNNRQEGYNTYLAENNLTKEAFAIDDLDSGDNPLQSYWLLGLTYNISR